MELLLTANILRSDFPHLKRDFNRGEQLLLLINQRNYCQGVHGITCTLGNDKEIHEIPMNAIAFYHQGNAYGIFVTEQTIGKTMWYCVAIPFDRLKLLHILQNQSAQELSNDLQKHKILKVKIEKNQIAFDYIKLLDIQALF